MPQSKKFQNLILYITYALLTGVALAALATGLFAGFRPLIALVSLLCAALSVVFAVFLRKALDKTPLWALLALCLIVKTAFVLIYRIEPENDYHTFYITSVDMSRGLLPATRGYLALFPHILGYSGFLSVFLSVFGESTLVAPLVNAGLSVLSMGLLYYCCRELISKRAGVLASLLWIICPSQTVYNMYALSEPLYTSLLLFSFAVLVFFWKRRSELSAAKSLACGLVLGVALLAMNAARPIAIIVIIAAVIYFVFFGREHRLRSALALVLSATALFCVGKLAYDRALNAYLGEKAGGFGYSVYVGLNYDSGGTWSQSAAERLNTYVSANGANAASVQAAMLEDAKELLKDRDLSLIRLGAKKTANLLAHDRAAVDYYSGGTFQNAKLWSDACDIFWYAVMLLSALGCVAAMRRRDKNPLVIVALYGFGLTLAQLLVEVAQRYHYSLMVCLCVFSALALDNAAAARKGKLDKNAAIY